MAVWSVVKVSELKEPKRIDAEYYKPDYINISNQLLKHNTVSLSSIARITDGIHASPDFESGSGIRYISAKCVRDCQFNLNNVEEISSTQHSSNPRTSLKVNDVIISTVGTIGFCAVVSEDIIPANCDRHVGIVRIRDTNRIDPHFVAAFLNTKYGRNQTIREATGNVQLNLFIYAIKEIKVPLYEGQRQIGDIVRQGLELIKKSDSLYIQAERLILQEIGWNTLNLLQPTWWKVPLSRTKKIQRLDAEHFQPKYDKLITHLKKTGKSKQIKDLLSEPIQKGITPDYFQEGQIVVVNSQHLGRYGLNYEETDRTTEVFWRTNKRAHIYKNDVMIYATGAYIGRSNVYLETTPAFAGVDILLVRPKEECNPIYLAVFLNAVSGLMQSEKFSRGSGQSHIYPSASSQLN